MVYSGINVDNNEIWSMVQPGNVPTLPNFTPDSNVGHRLAPWADAAHPASVVINTARYADSNVKRVVAMIRSAGGNSQLDGSTLTATWSGCQIHPYNAAANAANGGYVNWTANNVNQGRTGYDAPRTGDVSFDKRYAGKATSVSKPIVEFLAPDANGVIVAQPAMRLRDPLVDNGRYTSETVRFNLGTLLRPVGDAVK